MNNKSNEVNDKNYNVSYKKILLIFSITLAIILALAILFYININKDTSKVIKGSIKYVGDDYIILTDTDNDDEYIIDVDDIDLEDKCEVGDELSLTIGKIKDAKDPIEAEAKNFKILSKAKKDDELVIEEKNTENTDNSNNTNNNNSNSNEVTTNDTSSNNNTSSNNSNQTNNTVQSSNIDGSENDVITYFNNVDAEIDRSSNNKTLSERAKSGFTTVVDFLFYDRPIKGKTFKELGSSAKLKVLKLGISIDKKIDNNFPDYKNTLYNKYKNVKSLAISKYLDKTTEVCARNEDTCNEAKKGLSELKNNFSITWSFIKDISGVGLSKLKTWYDIWRVS